MAEKDMICNPICFKHEAIRPCPICDKQKKRGVEVREDVKEK